jgi:rSAM/selenodomain-associated transferase 2
MPLAIIVPALNEGTTIGAALAALQPLRARGARVIVVDGSSTDQTREQARPLADDVIVTERGRARQMNAGARAAGSMEVLLFLHADTRLPPDADSLIAGAIARGARWGRFDVRIDGRPVMLRWIATLMNLRSRLTGICTGDQAFFVGQTFFNALGGFPDQPLMEDVEFSRRARRLARPVVLAPAAVTSGRRWEQDGVWRTVVRMWMLRWRYWLGADPAELARGYRETR